MVFTDPPYNVPIDGHVSGLGKVKHREFAVASGEMSEAEFTGFLRSVFANLAERIDRRRDQLRRDGLAARGRGRDRGKRRLQRVQEPLRLVQDQRRHGFALPLTARAVLRVQDAGPAPHINNVELGKHGRYRTNVWSYAGANSFSATRDDDLAMHPTVKPVALVADAILDCSHRKGIILDAFAGSGTTLVAAHKTGRRGYGIELDPLYCDVIVRRMAKVAKLEAVLAASGQTFDAVAAERAPRPKPKPNQLIPLQQGRQAWRPRNDDQTRSRCCCRMLTGRCSASEAAAQKTTRRRKRKPSRQAVARKTGQIDLGALLQEPLRVLKDGKTAKMDPVEAAIRKQVAKALKDKSLPAIKEVIDLAIKHGLVATPERQQGGVLVIPKTVSDADQKFIFSYPGPSAAQIMKFLEHHYDQLEPTR